MNTERDHTDPPSTAEIAALLRRLRALSAAGPDADPDERAAFLADKNALLARIPGWTGDDGQDADPDDPDPDDGDLEEPTGRAQ